MAATVPAGRLLGPPALDGAAALYDRLAPLYGALHRVWLGCSGSGVQRAAVRELEPVLRPEARVLDAGCGHGALARHIHALEPRVRLTLLDASPAMLARATDVPGDRVRASVLAIPFGDAEFDVVVSAWVIETLRDPRRALAEYARVLAPDGLLVYTFCALPAARLARAASAVTRSLVTSCFAGRFLAPDLSPPGDWQELVRARSRRQLAVGVATRKHG